jgi:hypothetical protein
VSWSRGSAAAASRKAGPQALPTGIQIKARQWCGSYALASEQFTAQNVGSKSLACKTLKVRLGPSIDPTALHSIDSNQQSCWVLVAAGFSEVGGVV